MMSGDSKYVVPEKKTKAFIPMTTSMSVIKCLPVLLGYKTFNINLFGFFFVEYFLAF